MAALREPLRLWSCEKSGRPGEPDRRNHAPGSFDKSTVGDDREILDAFGQEMFALLQFQEAMERVTGLACGSRDMRTQPRLHDGLLEVRPPQLGSSHLVPSLALARTIGRGALPPITRFR